MDDLESSGGLKGAGVYWEIHLPEESSHVEHPPEVDLEEEVVKEYTYARRQEEEVVDK